MSAVADSVRERRRESLSHPSFASQNGHAAAAPMVRRMRIWGTPGQIWLLTTIFLLASSVVVLSIHAEVDGARQTFDAIGTHGEPNLTYAQDLYFVLAAMDADAADYLLVAANPSPPLTTDRIRGDYQALRQTAVNLAISAAQNVVNSDQRYGLYRLQTRLHLFDSDVAIAWQLSDQGRRADAILAWEQATDIMQNEVDGILEAALSLADIDRQTLDTAYAQSQAQPAPSRLPIVVAVAGSAGIVSLALLMLYLFRRTRRVVNPPLVVAGILALAMIAGAYQALAVSGERLRTAKQAYDTVDAIRQTRAFVFDSKAEESRYLLDPGRRRMYESVFLLRSRSVATFASRPTLATYDAALAQQLEVLERGGTPALGGSLGIALSGVSGDEEAATARTVVASYAKFQADDRVLRGAVARNDVREAVRLSLSSQPGESQGDLIALDADLGSWIGIEQTRGDANLATGAQALDGWQWIPLAALALVAGLAYLGIRPRLREYPGIVSIIADRLTTSR